MLQIKINNGWVDLFPGASIKYIFNSTAFSDSSIVGDFSYSLSLPDNENNARLLGFISNPNLYNQVSKHECELYYENVLLISGVFNVTSSISDVKISGTFVNSAYDFINTIKDKTTKEIDLGGDHEFASPSEYDVYIYNMFFGSYPEFKFAKFPILNETYLNGSQDEENWQDILYINPYSPSGNNVYFPYLAYIIDQIFAEFGYRITNVIGEHPELNKLCLIGLYEDTHLNTFIGFNLHHHILKVKLTKLLDSIKSTLGISFFFDHKTKQVKSIFLKDLLKTNNHVDWTSKAMGQMEKVIDNTNRGFKLSHEFDTSDSTMSEIQLPKGIIENAIIDSEVLTPADLPIYSNMGIHAGEIRPVTCEDMYYIIVDIEPDPNTNSNYQWTRLSWNFFGRICGDGATEKKSNLTTLGMHWHSIKRLGGNSWMTPHSDQVLLRKPLSGTMALLKPGNQNYGLVEPLADEFEPRVLFFRNMQPDITDTLYPLGTSGIHNAKGEIIGTQTLNWDGPNGLYEKIWKEWLTFIDTSITYKESFNLDLLDIINMDITKQIRVENNYYIIKKIEIDLPIKKAASVTMVRV
jgi:hypothetical protein